MARVVIGGLRLVDASEILGISYRQTKRVRKRYREEGDIGLPALARGTEFMSMDYKSFLTLRIECLIFNARSGPGVHRSRGRESNRGIEKDLWAKVIDLYRNRYPGFGPTLFLREA